MSEPKHESESGLIIDPAVLADIRAQCQRRRAELEAAGSLPVPTIAPESPQSAPAALPALSPIPLAKTFCGLGNYPSHKSPADQRAKFEKRERIGSSCKTYKSFSRPAIF